MNYTTDNTRIPGTVLRRTDYGNATGKAFLDRIFFLDDSVMLGQVRAISGVESSTMQNWVKRGWLMNTVNRRYSREHLARILIINMLRPVMQLEEIDRILRYVNGDTESVEDDIITESDFYDLICRCIDRLSQENGANAASVRKISTECTQTVRESVPGAASRLQKALCVIVPAYFASLVLEDVRDGYADICQDT